MEENQNTIDKLINTMTRELGAFIPRDDIVQAAYEGFLKACEKYNPEKGASFKTYVWIRMYGTVMDEFRQQRLFGKNAYKQEVKPTTVEYNLERHGTSVEMCVEDTLAFSALIAPLKNKKEKTILELYYISGLTLVEIAIIYGCSESRICQFHRSALGDLKRYYDTFGMH